MEVIQGGDAGTVVNQAILAKGNPQADVLFGIDSTFLTRALDEDLFVPYEAKDLGAGRRPVPARPRAPRHADRLRRRVPQLRQGLVRRAPDVPVPTSLEDLADPAYADLLVVENPATSSPGLAFLLATVGALRRGRLAGRGGPSLRDNGVEVVDGWEDGLQRLVLRRWHQRGHPPARRVVRVEPAGRGALRRPARRPRRPPASSRRAATARSRAPGILARHRPRGRGAAAHRLPALRALPGRRAAVDVRVPGARRGRRCPTCSSSTRPRRPRSVRAAGRRHRRAPRGRGSTSGPTSCSADGPRRRAGGAGRAAGPAGRVPRSCFFAWPVANIVGEGLRGDGGWDLSGVGDVLGDADLRQVAWFTLWQAAASTALTLAVALPAAHVLARYEFRGRRVVQALGHRAVRPADRGGRRRLRRAARPDEPDRRRPRGHACGRSCSPTPSSTTPSSCAPSAACGSCSIPRTEEAARVLGASPLARGCAPSRSRRCARPSRRPRSSRSSSRSRPSAWCASSAGPSHATLEVEIYRQTADLLNLPVASVLALLQLAAVGAMLVVQGRLARRWTRAAVALRPAPRRRAAGPAGAGVGRAATWSPSRSCWCTPLAVLVERSFRTGDGYGLAAWRALADRTAARAACSCRRWRPSGNSLRFAAGGDGARRRARRPGRRRAGPLARPGGPGDRRRPAPPARHVAPSPWASGSSSRSTSPSTCGPARGSSPSPRRWWRCRSSCAR